MFSTASMAAVQAPEWPGICIISASFRRPGLAVREREPNVYLFEICAAPASSVRHFRREGDERLE